MRKDKGIDIHDLDKFIEGKKASEALIGNLVGKLNSRLRLQKNYCTSGIDQGDKSTVEIRRLAGKA